VRADEFQGKTSTSGIKLNGLRITGFSIDQTFTNPSDLLVPSQLAVRNYVMNYVAANAGGLVQTVANTATVNLSVASGQLTATANISAINYFSKVGSILSPSEGTNYINVKGIDINRIGPSIFFGAPTGGSLSSSLYIGDDSGRLATGEQNGTFGRQAGKSLTTGTGNLLFGIQAGFSETNGTNNFYGGSFSGYNSNGANNNTCIGTSSGLGIINSQNNLFLGAFAGRYETGSNTMILSTTNPTSEANNRDNAWIYANNTNMFINRNLGVGLLASSGNPTDKLHVVGSVRVTGAYKDSSNSPGTSTWILSSTGTGTAWINPSTLVDGNGIYGGSGSWGATNVTGTGSGLLFLKSEAAGVSNTSVSIGNGTLSLTADDLTSADLGVVNVTNTSVQLSVTDGTTTGQISLTEKNASLVANNGVIGIEGTEKPRTVLKTANYTVVQGDNLLVGGVAQNVTFTLPGSANRVNGQKHSFGNVTTATFTVTIDGDGSDLVGTATTVDVPRGKMYSVVWSSEYGGWLLAD
jgi:hypothetical protein